MKDDEPRLLPAETMVEPTAAAVAPTAAPEAALDGDLPVAGADRYQLEGEHARGALGRVLRARDRRLHRDVAVKQLVAPGGRADARFVREAFVTARLQHPSIVPVYDAGRTPAGEPFLAMKMVDGRTLEAAIAETATLDARVALLPNVIAIAEAMAYAHSQGVIHRDLKPSNVLVGSFGETVVVDWGLARDLRAPADEAAPDDAAPAPPDDAALTIAGTIMGTPAYMPPEQALGRPVDERADVYALGAILYHVLAGAPPYPGTDSKAVLAAVLAARPTPLAERAPGVAIDLATIVGKAMARDPAARYASARELAEDLRRFQTGQLVGAHHYTRRTLAWRWLVRNRAIVAVAAILTTILAVTGVVSVRRILAERAATEARKNELILLQARSELDKDPTKSIEWLKTYPADAADWAEAANIAADAQSRGVAMHVLDGPRENVYQLAWSPDARTVATAGSDRTIRAWDALSGHSLGIAHTSAPVNAVAFSRDGTMIAGGDDGGEITLWRPHDGSRRTLRCSARVEWLDFSPDGTHLASADDSGEIRLWDATSGSMRVLGTHKGSSGVVRSARDGSFLVSTGADGVGVWPVTGSAGRILTGHTDAVRDVAISPDERTIASASMDGTVRLWDVASGGSRVLAGHTAGVEAIAFSPDGKLIASAGDDHTARLWDTATGAELRTLRGHDETLDTVSFSADGASLATAGFDGVISIWDVASGTRQTLLGHAGWVAARFAPIGDALVSGGHDLDVRLWRPPQRPVRTLVGNAAGVFSVASCPDGHFVSAGVDRTVRLFDVATGEARELDHHEDRVALARCAPTSKSVASLGVDGRVRVVDLATGTATPLDERARDLAYAPDGRTLAVGGSDHVVRLYDTETWSVRQLRVPTAIEALAFAPDGTHLAIDGTDGALEVWDLANSQRTAVATNVASLPSFVYSADGARIAWVARDNHIAVWDARSGARTIGELDGIITSVAFSPSGARVVATSTDRVAAIWELASDRTWRLPHDDLVRAGVFLSDDLLVTGSNDGTVIYWNLEDGSRHIYRGGSGYVIALAVSADGSLVASGGTDPVIPVWRKPREWVPSSPRDWLSTATTATLQVHPR